MDISQLTAKERKAARKDLLKMIDSYNKQQRKTRRPSFPLSPPSKDLMYKGIVKVTYDRGYATQTKSLLLESTTTAAETVAQLCQCLNLRGTPMDYALEEHNLRTGEIRVLDGREIPLKLQLNHSQKKPYIELRLLQVRDVLAPPMMSSTPKRGGVVGGMVRTDSEDSLEGDGNNIVPKEEVIDHGISSVEVLMEEALQDVPPLVKDIQERLRLLSETITVDGKPRAGLPSRRMLWDILKPQASAFGIVTLISSAMLSVSTLVKDIRRLVDNGEFIANKHCTSHDVRLMVTLLLELITDHTRELVSVTKQMCGLRGTVPIDFSLSLTHFIQQITNISRLVGQTCDMLQAMAITGHLLEATTPGSFLHSPLQAESHFSGSGAVSGVLIFTVVSSELGLVRAAYEEKSEYFASLASNILRSSQRALETIHRTNEYGLLHLHPLRSRVKDMEHKVKVAMDNLIRTIKMAASSHPLPYFAPDMLLCGHHLTLATLDFLMVVQCASLTHRVVIHGWDLMQLPWVKVYAGSDSGQDSKSEATGCTVAEQLSSISDSTSSTGDSGVHQKVEKYGERRSRIQRDKKGMATPEDSPKQDSDDGRTRLRFDQLGLRASRLKLPYYRSVCMDDERSPDPSPPNTPTTRSVSSCSAGSESHSNDESSPSIQRKPSRAVDGALAHKGAGLISEGSGYMGGDALKKLKLHYHVNKAIAKGAESLFLTVTQKASVLGDLCQDGMKEMYGDLVQQLVVAATRLSEEVGMLEEDVLVGQTRRKRGHRIEKSQTDLEAAIRDTQLACLMASGSMAPSSAGSKLMTAVNTLKEMCSRSVAGALGTVGEHRKALEQAERMEQEYVCLMTGQRSVDDSMTQSDVTEREGEEEGETRMRRLSSTAKLLAIGEVNPTGILYEEKDTASPMWKSSRTAWTMKEAPLVSGATAQQLVVWLTYHRAIDAEFADTFLLTFPSFMSPEHLLTSLISRFNLCPPQQLDTVEQEAFETDIVIPVRLRVVHALHVWITSSYDDFKDGHAPRSLLDKFLNTIESSLPTCAQQLRNVLATNVKSGPAHLHASPHSKPPSSLVPPDIASNHNSFDLLDVNSLELARQFTIAFNSLLRDIRPHELLSLGWRDDSTAHLCPHIILFQQLARKVSGLVCREVVRETLEEDRSSVISYFIETAKSCRDLKNFVGVFAIMDGLMQSVTREQESAWQSVTDHLLCIHRELRDLVSPDDSHHRYRQDVRVLHQSPVVPHLGILLSDMEEIDSTLNDFLPDSSQEVVNFSKRRLQAKLVRQLQRHQSVPYNLTPVDIMQRYIRDLPEPEIENDR